MNPFLILVIMVAFGTGCASNKTMAQKVEAKKEKTRATSVESAERYCKAKGKEAVFAVEKTHELGKRRPPKSAKASWVLADDAKALDVPASTSSATRVPPSKQEDTNADVAFHCE